jgi:hypothetical protein
MYTYINNIHSYTYRGIHTYLMYRQFCYLRMASCNDDGDDNDGDNDNGNDDNDNDGDNDNGNDDNDNDDNDNDDNDNI